MDVDRGTRMNDARRRPADASLGTFLDDLTDRELIQRLELALEGSGLGIWDWDPRDNSVQFDRRWCEMLGLDHAAVEMDLQTWVSATFFNKLKRRTSWSCGVCGCSARGARRAGRGRERRLV